MHTYDLADIKRLGARLHPRLSWRRITALKAGEKQCKYCKAMDFALNLIKQEAISKVGDATTLRLAS